MKFKKVVAMFLAAMMTLQSVVTLGATFDGNEELPPSWEESLKQAEPETMEELTEEPEATQEPEETEELEATQEPKETEESEETQEPKETEDPEELQTPRETQELVETQEPEEPVALDEPGNPEAVNESAEIELEESNAGQQESFALEKGTVTDKGTLSKGFSWTLDNKGLFTITSAAGLNGFGERITQVSGLSEAKRRQVKTIYFESGTWNHGTYDDSLFPNAQTLVVGEKVRAYYDNEDRYNDNGAKKNTTIKSIQILGESHVALHKYLALENVQASGNMGQLNLNACSQLQTITVTGSVEEVLAEDCTALKTVYVRKWRSADTWQNNFQGDTSLESVIVAETASGFWSLGDAAFANCTNLREIKVPAKLREIGCSYYGADAPFYGCDALQEFPDFSYVETLGDYAFRNCANLIEADFPNLKDKQEVSGVFSGCANLERVSLSGPQMNTISLDSGNFEDCTSLKSVEIDADITKLGIGEFENCSSLTDFPDFSSVKSIGIEAFLNCAGLERITIRESLSSMGKSAFKGCTGLKKAYFQKVDDWYAENTFENCVSLEAMVIGEMEEAASFGGRTFYNCGKLKTLVMPKGIRSLNEEEFYKCGSLQKLPDLSELKWVNTSYTKDRTTRVFYGCSSLEEVVFPETTDIDGNKFSMFENCSSLKRVVMPVKTGDLGMYMFAGCGSLEKIEGLEKAGDVAGVESNAFKGCESLKELKLPDTVRYINSYPEGLEVFEFPEKMSAVKIRYAETPNLREVTIPETAPILEEAFKDHGTLETVTLAGNRPEIPRRAFSGCANLKKVQFPTGLTDIKAFAFLNCSRLESVQLPEGTANIGESAFSGCADLKSVQLPDSLRTIDKQAFQGCASLGGVALPAGLTAIGESAFSASGLKEIEIPAEVAEIKSRTFYECPNLARVGMSSGSKKIRNDAFSGGMDKLILLSQALQMDGNAISNAREVIIDSPDVTMLSSALQMRAGTAKVYFMQGALEFSNGSITQKSEPGVKNQLYVYIAPEVSAISGTLANSSATSVTIIGETGSLAEEYAVKKGYTFQSLDGEHNQDDPENVGSIQKDFQYRIENQKAIVIEYIGRSKDVNTPETLGGYPVAKIQAGAFRSRILANGEEGIEKIHFPASVETVEPGFASSWMTSLKEVTVDAANPHLVVIDGGLYSKDRTKLILALPYAKNISIPNTVKVIGGNAFKDTGVQEVNLPDSVQRLEENSFSSQRLIKVTLPNTLKEIGPRAFAGSALAELEIPVGVKAIGEEAFSGSKLEHLDLPDTVEALGDRAFSKANEMLFVTLRENVKTLGEDLFAKSEKCSIYGIGASKAERELQREYPDQYERGATLGRYTLGMYVRDDTGINSGRMLHSGNNISVKFTKPMCMVSGKRSGGIDCATGKKYINETGYEMGKIEEMQIAITNGLPSETEFAVMVEAGSLREPKTGDEIGEWDSRGVWSKKTMEDFWGTSNPTEEIPQGLFQWMLGHGKGNVQKIINDGKNGICFGMATTAALVRSSLPDIATFGEKQLYSTGPEARSSALNGLDLKTYWQLSYILQFTPAVSKSLNETKNDYEGMIAAVKEMVIDKKTLCVIGVENWGGGYHALLPYSIKENKDGTIIEIEIYDCNAPNKEYVLKVVKNAGGYSVGAISGRNEVISYKGIKYWKITNQVNEVAKAYANGDPRPDLGMDFGDVLNLIMPSSALDALGEAENMVIRKGAKTATVKNGEMQGDALVEISQMGDSSQGAASGSHLYWTDGSSPLEVSGLNKRVQVALTGDYSQVQVGGCNGSSARLDAADRQGETTLAEITTGRKNQFQLKIAYPGEPEKEIESIELEGTAAQKAVVQDSSQGAVVEGAAQMSVTVIRDGEEKKEDLKELNQYKKIEISVDKDTEEIVVKGDTNGDGEMDETINKPKPAQKVEEIKLSQTQLSLYPTQKATLTAQALPQSAANKSLKFVSGSPAVASVTSAGVITAKKSGTAHIKAMAQDGSGVTAVCKVTVKKAVVKLNATKIPLQKSKSTTALKVMEMEKGDKITSWVSSKPKIVSVAANGKLKAGKKLGQSTITVKTEFGAKAKCIVTVQKKKPALKSFTVAGKEKAINKNKVTLKKGKKLTLIINRNPITSTEKLKYASSAPKVASVTQKGVIKAKKKGKCKITIKSGNKKKKTVTITVK